MNESQPSAETVLETPPANETLELVEVPAFNVRNRTSADRIAKILYGPNARTWINRTITEAGDTGVQVGTEKGTDKRVLTFGVDFAEALQMPVLTYLVSADSFTDLEARIRKMSVAGCLPAAFMNETFALHPEGRKIL